MEDITIQVHIWHGVADVNDPLQCGAYLRDTIPKPHATFFPGEGHFFIMKRWSKILAVLVAEPVILNLCNGQTHLAQKRSSTLSL